MDTLVEDDRVKGAVIVNKSGPQAIRAKVTIDCSADGDVAYKAGSAMEVGRKSDGLTQPMTMFFRVAGVDDARFQHIRNGLDEQQFAIPFADSK